MKKPMIALAVLAGLLGLAFIALLFGTSPDDAPSAPVVIDLPDTFER